MVRVGGEFVILFLVREYCLWLVRKRLASLNRMMSTCVDEGGNGE